MCKCDVCFEGNSNNVGRKKLNILYYYVVAWGGIVIVVELGRGGVLEKG